MSSNQTDGNNMKRIIALAVLAVALMAAAPAAADDSSLAAQLAQVTAERDALAAELATVTAERDDFHDQATSAYGWLNYWHGGFTNMVERYRSSVRAYNRQARRHNRMIRCIHRFVRRGNSQAIPLCYEWARAIRPESVN